MTLLDDFRAVARPRGPSCTVSITLNALSESDRADLQAAFTDPSIPSTVMSRVLLARGHKLPAESIGRHRRGDCKCSTN